MPAVLFPTFLLILKHLAQTTAVSCSYVMIKHTITSSSVCHSIQSYYYLELFYFVCVSAVCRVLIVIYPTRLTHGFGMSSLFTVEFLALRRYPCT